MSHAYATHDEDDASYYGIEAGERMVAFQPKATPESSPEPVENPVSPPSSRSGAENAKARRKAQGSKGDAYLIRTAFPNHPDVARTAEHHLPSVESGDESMEDVADLDEKLALLMAEADQKPQQVKDVIRAEIEENEPSPKAVSPSREEEMVDAPAPDERPRKEPESREQNPEHATNYAQRIATDALREIKIDSPDDQISPLDRVEPNHHHINNGLSFRVPPHEQPNGLRIQNVYIKPEVPMTPVEPNFVSSDPFSAWSPLSRHRSSVGSPGESLPAMLQSPTSPDTATSPLTQLPSAKEIIDLADNVNEAQRQRHASMSSMAAPSPMAHERYRASFSNAHPSPRMVNEATSPKSSLVLSPPSGVWRRESYPLMSSATTGSDSNTDIASPNTLPTPQSEPRQSIDEHMRTLPPIPGVGRPSISVSTIPAAGSGGYKCDFPGCTALPFQTSYLLNSHANVHSTNRPHYCPVPGCPRGEGGKGFKRKNEMIRHGLVHDSPGYVCPFCPDREHKYPRPDNLQRHVRVHHVDRNKDDPALREVLAQRPELGGATRGRRRRL